MTGIKISVVRGQETVVVDIDELEPQERSRALAILKNNDIDPQPMIGGLCDYIRDRLEDHRQIPYEQAEFIDIFRHYKLFHWIKRAREDDLLDIDVVSYERLLEFADSLQLG